MFLDPERENLVQLGMKALRSKDGEKALEYLKVTRGFSDSVIDDFMMGYCPEDVNHELAGRIITPICDAYGKIVAISSRRMEKDHPFRFFHESFDKGFYLYGFHLAKKAILKTGKCIVVEGEMDVGAFHTHGLNMTVGLCGSALSIFQASMILRYCSEVFLLFDSDENQSGQRAAKRALDLYGQHIKSVYGESNIRFIPVYLETGIDPDEFVIKNGSDMVIEKLKQAKSKVVNKEVK